VFRLVWKDFTHAALGIFLVAIASWNEMDMRVEHRLTGTFTG
jgi:hypothetical protein